MRQVCLKFWVQLQCLAIGDDGQDLIEYAMVAAILSLAAVATMGTLANALSTAFGNITTQFNNALK